MPLELGTRLGPYEVTAPIGAGGMGEVYRARDTKLNRDVALKVLPESFTDDPERVARFQREAEVLASLNHPNIAQIYGLEDSGDTTALVLELVEGPTLADRIAEGVIPVDEALAIANQVAVALEAAHEQGIIHRDLKPANIKVTPDGVVKVLDFGLAKALESERGGDASESPTIATAVTGMGMIMGTAAYMSPEQARGKPVDRRADIWAFGVVVLEMLTGKRVFDAEDVSLTLADVMKSEPDWQALPHDVSPVLRTFLRRCLQKDPKHRIRDIGDMRLAMEGAFETELTPVASVSEPRRRATPALLIFVAAVTGLVVWAATRLAALPLKVSRTAIVLPDSQVRTNTGRRGIAVSLDGKRVVYVANEQLYLRAVDELDAKPIEGTEGSGPTLPFFSPDGQWIGFYSTRDVELQKIALSGGAAVSLCSARNLYGASWDRDGTIVFGQGPGGILRIAAAGGTPEVLVAAEGEQRLHGPQMLPGGGSVLFTISQGDWNEAEIIVQSLSTGERRVLVEGGTDARYLTSGHLVYALAGNILAVPFDLERLEIVGGPVPVVGDVLHAGTTGGVNFDVSRDGMLVYLSSGVEDAQRTPVWVDREGREEHIAAGPRDYREARSSPNGSHAVLVAADEEDDLWVWDFARETLTRLTFGPNLDQSPVWTPDGRSVVYTSGDVRNVHRKAVDGTGGAERLTESPNRHYPLAVTPDGNRLVLNEFYNDGGGSRFSVLVLEGEPVVEPLLDNGFLLTNADLSPDGRWLAYETNASGAWEVYVRPYPDVDSGRWQISSGGGHYPFWGPDGRELFFLGNGYLMRVEIEWDPFRPGNPEPIIEMDAYYNDRFRRAFDIAPDGRRFLMFKNVATSDNDDGYAGLARIIVVQNWFEELNARVPVE